MADQHARLPKHAAVASQSPEFAETQRPHSAARLGEVARGRLVQSSPHSALQDV